MQTCFPDNFTARLLRAFVLRSLLVLPFCAAAESRTNARGFLWEARSDTATVYLFGSVHVGYAGLYPLADHVMDTFRESAKLAVEADVRPFMQLQVLPSFLDRIFLPPGESLRDSVPENIRILLDDYMTELGSVTAAALDRMQPWLAAMVITMTETQKSGYGIEHGVDLYFLQQAENNGVPIVELEGIAAQLEVFAAMEAELQHTMLKNSLKERHQVRERIELVMKAWENGDEEILRQELKRSFEKDEGTTLLKQLILTDRDEAMAQRIAEFLEADETVFVVVGAGHLLGKKSIVARLREKAGIVIERK